MKDDDKNKEPPYIQYWGVNNLYGWAVPEKLPVNKLEWIKDASQFNESYIKSYNQEHDEGYFLEVVVQYLKKWHKLRNDLPFIPKIMKIEKVKKLFRNLKQALNHRLVLKKSV